MEKGEATLLLITIKEKKGNWRFAAKGESLKTYLYSKIRRVYQEYHRTTWRGTPKEIELD